MRKEQTNSKKQILFMILGIIFLLLITVGVTYAFFVYTKLGSTENKITTGSLQFVYTENTGVGNGISITNALPISDSLGKSYATEGYVFDFRVQAKTIGDVSLPYEVTVRKGDYSDLDEDVVKVYLTEVNGNDETDAPLTLHLGEIKTFDLLRQTNVVSEDLAVEKTVYQGIIPANSNDYSQSFRLRIWIKEDTDFSGTKEENGNINYPYNNKSFTLKVNVYASTNTEITKSK